MTNEHDSRLKRLANSVARRVWLDDVVARFHLLALIIAGACLIVLLVARLTAVIPDVFPPIFLVVPVGLGIVFALLLSRRPPLRRVARRIDETMKTDDLFLTAAMIDQARGDYKTLVLERAEQKAETAKPTDIVPFHWTCRLVNVAIAIAVLALCARFVPQLDPFGKVERRQRANQKRKQLDALEKATRERLTRLKKKPITEKSEEVNVALDDLKRLFDSLKGGKKEMNQQKLRQMQKELAELWRRKSERKLQDSNRKRLSRQTFGSKNPNQNRWRRQIRKGDLSGVKKEIQELKRLAKEAAKAKSAEERKKKLSQLRQRTKQLSDFLKSEMGSKQVDAAMNRACKQCDMANMDKMTKDALRSMAESMDLGERELEKLSQMSNDLEGLEQAMKASQLAQQLNKLNEMKNANREGLEDMQDYADYYEELMKQCQCQGDGKEGKGRGFGKPGDGGKGGKPPEEDDSTKTKFKSEASKSQLQAGKILLKWKIRSMSKTGAVEEDYATSIKKVKQGVSEAILKERAPPGYHEAIKHYFDSLDPKESQKPTNPTTEK